MKLCLVELFKQVPFFFQTETILLTEFLQF